MMNGDPMQYEIIFNDFKMDDRREKCRCHNFRCNAESNMTNSFADEIYNENQMRR